MSKDIKNSMWVEKYRPSELDEFIGNDHMKTKFSEWIEEGQVPNLMFHGEAGTGKTSAAKMLADKIGAEVLYLNCSDENSVDTVRTKIKSFASTRGFKDKKVAICDEFDYMSKEGQAALRNISEERSDNCRFIFTCNYIDKVIDAIKSRCVTFDVHPPSPKQVAIKIATILRNEGISYENADIIKMVMSHYPDVRRIINECQSACVDGELVVTDESLKRRDYMDKILNLIIDSNDEDSFIKKSRKVIQNSNERRFYDFYRYLYSRVFDYAPKGKRGECILIISEALKHETLIVDKEINLMNALLNIFKTIK